MTIPLYHQIVKKIRHVWRVVSVAGERAPVTLLQYLSLERKGLTGSALTRKNGSDVVGYASNNRGYSPGCIWRKARIAREAR